jgi:hypothetical protein
LRSCFGMSSLPKANQPLEPVHPLFSLPQCRCGKPRPSCGGLLRSHQTAHMGSSHRPVGHPFNIFPAADQGRWRKLEAEGDYDRRVKPVRTIIGASSTQERIALASARAISIATPPRDHWGGKGGSSPIFSEGIPLGVGPNVGCRVPAGHGGSPLELWP